MPDDSDKKLSKKEKRVIREAQKLEKQTEKNARFSDSIVIKDQFVRIGVTPSLDQFPSINVELNHHEAYFEWCFTQSDKEGSWSWKGGEPRNWSQDEEDQDLSPHLKGLGRSSWGQVEQMDYNGSKNYRKLLNKYQPIDSICKEAQERWFSIPEIAMAEELFRLRLGSNKRVWGFRINHHFFVIWYERYHQICPVD